MDLFNEVSLCFSSLALLTSYSAPIGGIGLFLSVFGIPNGFPFHDRVDLPTNSPLPKSTFSRVDLLGTVIILVATVSITAAFQEADSRYPWNSAYTITLLSVSVLLWATLLAWERHVTIASKVREPILPWRFFTNRIMAGLLL